MFDILKYKYENKKLKTDLEEQKLQNSIYELIIKQYENDNSEEINIKTRDMYSDLIHYIMNYHKELNDIYKAKKELEEKKMNLKKIESKYENELRKVIKKINKNNK